MDLFEDARPGTNAPEFTVSEISGAVKKTIEGQFGRVRVRGEVGRVSRPASGHIYLDLKDANASLGSVIWKTTARGLAIRPEEGMEVIATGRLTTFPGASKYQMIIEEIAPAGVGALMAMLEARRKALAAEGLFDAARKRPLPFLPEVIGVITSPSGAVIRDILHRLRDRFPRPVLLWPVTVQGDRCAPDVAAAIRGFNAIAPGGPIPRPDVLIVARGGGSIEDLWGFNEEIVVRAAAESAIPLISAVGHETDTTLIDLAADRRAPTPTAAAEMAVPVRLDLVAAVAALDARRGAALGRGLDQRGQRLRDLSRGLPRPEALFAERAQRIDALSQRLPRAIEALSRNLHLALSRGAAGRFGPGLLGLLIERRRRQLDRAEAGLRPDAMLAHIRARERTMARGPAGRFGPGLLALELERARASLARASLGLRPDGLTRAIAQRRERLDARGDRLARAGGARVRDARPALEALRRTLESLSPARVLDRGFAIVRDLRGNVVTSAAVAQRAPGLELEFADGRLAVRPATPARRRAPAPEDESGTLL
ncbi:exodeoxyribonuclease VII large subunit [Amaricoccus macauensis]|uniref:Exodeoxyribonuclease 7 large subunit n=1 Tax=Amaricoccus macauensis TaxID=57001 RepID=A0A840SVM6_9RHOB|nr:exodeoxyribonuclease VII large subunit [Amaricoccus macauensis]MBB5223323.1 exodeoxyribonuclease VII large subunit [Amaricoccus macauensis]